MAYADGGRRAALGLYNSSGDVGKLLAFTSIFSLGMGRWDRLAAGSLFFGLIALLTAAWIAVTVWRFKAGRNQEAERSTGGEGAEDPGWGILSWHSFRHAAGDDRTRTNMVQAGVLVFIAFLMIAKGLPLAVATLATVVLLIGGIFGKAGCGYLAEAHRTSAGRLHSFRY
jgi:hypothetical protein